MTNYVFVGTSLDGYVAGKDGDINWLNDIPNISNSDYGYNEFIEGIDALVMGRTTFELVQTFGDWFYLWNIMDEFTRFHLASVISKERKIKDARKAFQVAKKRSHGDRPKCIVTDGLKSYHKAINKEFHTVKKETMHIENVGIQGTKTVHGEIDNNLIERLNGTVRDRNKTQRGLKSEETIFTKGHQLYYNFVKPHETLNGYTPAHFANIYLNLGDEKWKNLFFGSLTSGLINLLF